MNRFHRHQNLQILSSKFALSLERQFHWLIIDIQKLTNLHLLSATLDCFSELPTSYSELKLGNVLTDK